MQCFWNSFLTTKEIIHNPSFCKTWETSLNHLTADVYNLMLLSFMNRNISSNNKPKMINKQLNSNYICIFTEWMMLYMKTGSNQETELSLFTYLMWLPTFNDLIPVCNTRGESYTHVRCMDKPVPLLHFQVC